MRGYNRVDEDLDEYEEDEDDQYEEIEGEEYEEAEEQEEEENPARKEEMSEYLQLRQRLKERVRRKLEKENGVASKCLPDKKISPLQRFGSFFGPSQPVIADRVIQESKSLLETRHLAPRHISSQIDRRKSVTSGASGPKNVVKDRPPQNPLKNKVQKLKDARDYSFLLSENTEVSGQTNGSSYRNSSDARSAQASIRTGKVPLNGHREGSFPGHRDARSGQGTSSSMQSGKVSLNRHEERKPVTTNSHSQRTNGLPVKNNSGSRPYPTTMDSRRELNSERQVGPRRQPGSSSGSGPGRPLMAKDLSSKKPLPSIEKKLPAGADRKLGASMVRKPPAASAERKASAASMNHRVSSVQRAPLVKSQTYGARMGVEQRRGMEQRRETLDTSKQRHLSSASVSSSRPQITNKAKEVPSRARLSEDRHKKSRKHGRSYSDEEDEDDPLAMVRKMFGYDPSKFRGIDDDDSDMEADFRTIQKEELRSSRIAKEEDERELRLLEEEEKRARMRKDAKKRKMNDY